MKKQVLDNKTQNSQKGVSNMAKVLSTKFVDLTKAKLGYLSYVIKQCDRLIIADSSRRIQTLQELYDLNRIMYHIQKDYPEKEILFTRINNGRIGTLIEYSPLVLKALYNNIPDQGKKVEINDKSLIDLRERTENPVSYLTALMSWLDTSLDVQTRKVLDDYLHPMRDALGFEMEYKISSRTKYNVLLNNNVKISQVKNFEKYFSFYKMTQKGILYRFSLENIIKFYTQKDYIQMKNDLKKTLNDTYGHTSITNKLPLNVIDLYCELYGFPKEQSEEEKRYFLNWIASQNLETKLYHINIDLGAERLITLAADLNNAALMKSIIELSKEREVSGSFKVGDTDEILSKISFHKDNGMTTKTILSDLGLEDYEELDEGDSDESSSDLPIDEYFVDDYPTTDEPTLGAQLSVAIIGSRKLTESQCLDMYDFIEEYLESKGYAFEDITFISGNAYGADQIANMFGTSVIKHYIPYKNHNLDVRYKGASYILFEDLPDLKQTYYKKMAHKLFPWVEKHVNLQPYIYRNMPIIDEADIVFWATEDNTVKGGTAYGVKTAEYLRKNTVQFKVKEVR